MTVLDVTTVEEWKKVLDTGEPVVVDFHGEAWCVPCQRFSPTFKKAAEERPDLTFVKVDVDVADSEISAPFNFMSVPSVFLVRGDEVTPLKYGIGPAFLRKVNEHVPAADSD